MGVKRKLISLVMAGAICVSALSGCTSIGLNDMDLMRPPKATGDKAEIQGIVEAAAGGDYTLKYPKNGDFRSAIVMEDLNGDGVDEAVVLFKSATENSSSTNILFLSEVDGKWKSMRSFKNANSDVDKIYIGDINNDGVKEVIVGWTSFIAGANQITYYQYSGTHVTETVIEDRYTEMVMCDLTGDNVQDLVLFSLTNEGTANSNAKLYSYGEKGVVKKSQVDLDTNITSFSHIQYSQVEKGIPGLFVDGYTVNNDELTTGVLFYDKQTETLKDPLSVWELFDNGTYINPTIRQSPAICRDIDEDGIMEVPVVTTMDGQETETETVCFVTYWNKLNTRTSLLSEVNHTVASYTDGYYFILPKAWENKVVAKSNTEARTIKFYLLDLEEEVLTDTDVDGNGKKGSSAFAEKETDVQLETTVGEKVLLTLQVFTEKDWEDNQASRMNEGYTSIGNIPGLVYAAKLPNEKIEGYGISLGTVIENFKIIDGETQS